MQLDHLVINTRYQTDLAVELCRALGFTVTPRGYHSLGSINNLVMFDGHYLELIGLPADSTVVREEIVNNPTGIDALVLRSDDADRTWQELSARGLAAQAVQPLSRPVEIDGEERLAAFRTVRMPGLFAAGRVYYCQHLTPDYLWRPEWLQHANGVRGIQAMYVIESGNPAEKARYAALPGAPGSAADAFDLRFLSRADFDARFGELAALVAPRADCYGAMSLRCASLGPIAARARQAGLPLRSGENSLVVGLPAFETLLEFTS